MQGFNRREWRVLRFVGNVLGGIFSFATLGMAFAALTVGGIFYTVSYTHLTLPTSDLV